MTDEEREARRLYVYEHGRPGENDRLPHVYKNYDYERRPWEQKPESADWSEEHPLVSTLVTMSVYFLFIFFPFLLWLHLPSALGGLAFLVLAWSVYGAAYLLWRGFILTLCAVLLPFAWIGHKLRRITTKSSRHTSA